MPLTIDDALANAGRFPLAMVWTPVRQTSRSYERTTEIGFILPLTARKNVAILITPTAYIPPSFSCPALSSNHLCSIHESKPLRCRTMPFYPYHDEEDQAAFLVPRKGWLCETSEPAPVVYRDRAIMDRTDFDVESKALQSDAPLLRAYGETVLKQNPAMKRLVMTSVQAPVAELTIMNFSSFLRLDKRNDLVGFAQQQHPVLMDFEARTAKDPDLVKYHKFYQDSAAELEWFVRRGSASATA